MSSRAFITIAIDGGAASGKSTTSRALADRYNLLHVDTGSHYRALTIALFEADIAVDNELAASGLSRLELSTEIIGHTAHIKISGRMPELPELRAPEINERVSLYAELPAVREFLINYQREQKQTAMDSGFDGLVMEGRDIGSVILPDADLRIFLEADAGKRMQRRASEGQTDSISERDKIDSARKTAPLICPEGALRIDTGNLSIDDVVNRIAEDIDVFSKA